VRSTKAHERLTRLAHQPNVLTLSCETHPGAPRLSGAPLAATNETSAGAVCKRRDALKLGGHEAARLPGLATSVSSASA